MKKFLQNIVLSFDNNDETGFDYKKLTAFWHVILGTLLVTSYSFKSINFYWLGVSCVFREDLVEFKYIIGEVFVFILVLTYFTNEKALTKFAATIKGKNEINTKQNTDSN